MEIVKVIGLVLLSMVVSSIDAADVAVLLSWEPSPTPNVTYRVYTARGVGAYTQQDTGTNRTFTSWTTPGEQAAWWVTAIGLGDIESDPSNVVKVLIPLPPEFLVVERSQILTNWMEFIRVRLDWQAGSVVTNTPHLTTTLTNRPAAMRLPPAPHGL